MITRSSFSCMGQFSSAPLKEHDLHATGHAVSYVGPNDSIAPEPVSLASMVTKILCSGIVWSMCVCMCGLLVWFYSPVSSIFALNRDHVIMKG